MPAYVLSLVGLLTAAGPTPLSVNIHGSLEATLQRVESNYGAALAAQSARLLRWRGDVTRDVHPGDRLWLLFEPPETAEAEPELLALRYQGQRISLRAYHFMQRADAPPRYFDAAGLAVAPALKDSPVADYIQITETVQSGRGKRKHEGLDLKAEVGDPVRLPWEATVTRVNWRTRLNGLCIEVVFNQTGYTARFLHLSSVGRDVKRGANLPAGTQIGTVGNTGRSSAAHLHYEIRTGAGKPLSPLRIHGTKQVKLQGATLADFQGVRRHYDRLIEQRPVALGGDSCRTGRNQVKQPLGCQP